jgi:hypothetical protein
MALRLCELCRNVTTNGKIAEHGYERQRNDCRQNPTPGHPTAWRSMGQPDGRILFLFGFGDTHRFIPFVGDAASNQMSDNVASPSSR